MTFHIIEGAGTPARIPHSMSPQQEFDLLLAMTDRAIDRLVELRGIISPVTPLPALPLSGLVQAAPGVLLFKRGRDA